MTLRDTIRETTKKHLDSGGTLFSQCVQAVGWVANTVPNDVRQGSIIELPTSDVSNGAVVTGFGLSGQRPIYIIRYQGFLTYNAASIVNYAAKSKAMWGVPCPIFVRGIAMEGSIGPVASNAHHSAIARFPGIRVHAPMSPTEWLECWNDFKEHDDPVFCSEHRMAYDNNGAIDSSVYHLNPLPRKIIIGIGNARKAAYAASQELYNCDYDFITQLKPLKLPKLIDSMRLPITQAFIVDSDFTECGMAEHVACEMYRQYGIPSLPIGIKDATAGFSPERDNLTPTVDEILDIVRKY